MPAFGHALWQQPSLGPSEIKTMSDLIAFTAEIANLRNAEPAFV